MKIDGLRGTAAHTGAARRRGRAGPGAISTSAPALLERLQPLDHVRRGSGLPRRKALGGGRSARTGNGQRARAAWAAAAHALGWPGRCRRAGRSFSPVASSTEPPTSPHPCPRAGSSPPRRAGRHRRSTFFEVGGHRQVGGLDDHGARWPATSSRVTLPSRLPSTACPWRRWRSPAALETERGGARAREPASHGLANHECPRPFVEARGSARLLSLSGSSSSLASSPCDDSRQAVYRRNRDAGST